MNLFQYQSLFIVSFNFIELSLAFYNSFNYQMNSVSTFKIKSSESNELKKLKNRSLSLFDSNSKLYKIQGKKIRLKTEYHDIKKEKQTKNMQKTLMMLNSTEYSKRKQFRCSQNEDFHPDIQPQQSIAENNNEKRQQHQWINSLLPTLSAQELYEQNIQLKKQCNLLRQFFQYQRQQNSKLLSKISAEKKEKQKLARQLSLSTEYYNFYEGLSQMQNPSINNKKSSSKPQLNNKHGFHPVNYMITGIKFRYEKLKEDYELKCKEVDQIYKITQYTSIQELIKETELLKRQNSQLVDRISELSFYLPAENGSNFGEDSSLKSIRLSKNLNSNVMSNSSIGLENFQAQSITNIKSLIQAKNKLEKSNNRLSSMNVLLNKKIATLTEQLNQKYTSIKNIQKSLTLVDNELYYKNKQNSKIQKSYKQTEAKIISLQKQNIIIKEQCEKQIEKIKRTSEVMFEKEKKIFLKQMEQKNQKINKLEKQLSYLSTLLKYWKPLDQDQKFSVCPQSSKFQNQDGQQALMKSSLLIFSNRKRTKTKVSQNQKSNQDFRLNLKEPVLSMKQTQLLQSSLSQSSLGEQTRVPKTSRRKHSNQGFKTRKINPLQIEYMKQQLKFRCMAKRLTTQQIKQFFNFNSQRLKYSTKKEQAWRQKYITMKELKQILLGQPFKLIKEEAFKLSRFVVEDASAEQIFCDQQNQIERQIVKSAIKAFIGDYQLPEIEKCRYELGRILQNYGVNLRKALDALSQKGQISPIKLFGLIESLSIQISDQLKNMMISRLYQKNQYSSLSSLKYQHIFQSEFI